MSGRLSLAARGPGVLASVLAAVIFAALLTRHTGHAARRPAAHLSSFQVTLTARSSRVDPATGVSASVEGAVTVPGEVIARPSRIALLLQVVLHNGGRKHTPVAPRSFYALAPSGATYTTVGVPAGFASLHRRLDPGEITVGWIAFRVPLPVPSLALIWNDENRLLPPGSLAKVTVRLNGSPARP